MPDRDGLRAVVIGAGVAGLACAADLAAAGAAVTVLEAGDAVGGRMRTDTTAAGFRLDRGFQVFNTSYPQVQRRLDLRALHLRPFTPGVLLHTPGGPDPVHRPDPAAGPAGRCPAGYAGHGRALISTSALGAGPAGAREGPGRRPPSAAPPSAAPPDWPPAPYRPAAGGAATAGKIRGSSGRPTTPAR